jgi:hypothetical protein
MIYSTELTAKMNVNKEANAGFMADLKREDRPRCQGLIRNIQIGRQARAAGTQSSKFTIFTGRSTSPSPFSVLR